MFQLADQLDIDNNGQQCTTIDSNGHTMDNNGQQLTTMDNNEY